MSIVGLAQRHRVSHRRRPVLVAAVSVLLPVIAVSAVATASASPPVNLVTKFAGSGTYGSGAPAPGPALAANLTYPLGLLFDPSGNMYFVDIYDNTVNKITPGGQLSVLAGTGNQSPSTTPVTGVATSADLNQPGALARDTAGNLYVAVEGQNVVEKIDTSGALTVVAGDGTMANPGTLATPGPATQTAFREPHGVAVDSTGNLYISDSNAVVYKVDTSGNLSLFAGSGATTPSASPVAATSAHLGETQGLAVDSSGNLYIAGASAHIVSKVTAAGQLTLFAGTGNALASHTLPAAGPATSADLNSPFAVTVDASGNAFIADPYGDILAEVNTSGQLRVIGGTGAGTAETWNSDATTSSLGGPEAVAVDPGGAVYFGDWNNAVIGRIAPASGPSAPTSLSATPGSSSGTADLSFDAPLYTYGATVTGYEVSTDGGTSWTPLTTSGSGPYTATATGMLGGSRTIRVRAVSSYGSGTAASAITTLPASVSAAPTALSATQGDASAALRFTAPSDTGGSAITGYEYSTDGSTWHSLTSSTNGSTVTGTVTGLTNATPYTVQVRAINGVGASPASGSVAVTPRHVTSIALGSNIIAPYTGVFDAAGNFYVSNERGPTWLHPSWIPTILKVTPAGAVSQYAVMGHGGIESLTIDASGTIYAANPNANAVSKIAPDGTVTEAWAPLPAGSSPLGIVLSGDGHTLYVTLSNTNTVATITLDANAPSGRVIDASWATLNAGSYPFGLALDASGRIYTANTGTDTISRITPNNGSTPTVTPAWATLSGSPSFLAFNSQGALFVPYVGGGDGVAEIDNSGAVVHTWPTGDQPVGIGIDSQDNVYVTGYSSNTIDRIDAHGTLELGFAATGSLPTSAVISPSDDVYATNDGDGTITVVPADPAAPGAPTLLSATPANQQAALSLAAPISTGHQGITGYQVSLNGGAWTPVTISGTGPYTATLSSLTNGTTYQVKVRATNASGAGTASNMLSVTPGNAVPAAAAAPTANAGIQSAVVSWVAPASSTTITGYVLTAYRNGVAQPSTTVSAATSHTVTGLTPGASYTFTVAAINAAGTATASPASNPVVPLPYPQPNAPTTPAVPAAAAGTSSITVTWPAASGTISGYTAYASPGPATCTTTGTTTCVIGATAGTTYTVTVVAHGPGGDSAASPASNPVTATAPSAPPSVPSEVPLTLTTDKGQLSLATPAQQITVIGTGFAPYSTATVTVYSSPLLLGTVTTDANGDFAKPVTIPATLQAGPHTFLATGVNPQGAARQMALPITVVASQQSTNGNNGSTQHTTLPVPSGGAITLLDSGGNPVNTVTITNQGTYALDTTTGVITFVPVNGFTGRATPVTYRLTDAVGTVVTGTYTAMVGNGGTNNPGPPRPTSGITISLPRLTVTRGQPSAATLPVTATFTTATKGRTTVTLWGVISGKQVALGAGSATHNTTSHAVTVTVALNSLGRAVTARPGGYVITASAITLTSSATTLRANASTHLVLNHFTVPRSIYFATASSTISTTQKHYLLQLRAHLAGVREIVCTGNTDNRGNANKALGQRRAQATCATLAAGLKIRTVVVTKGATNPVGNNNTAAGKARNRRADITLYY